MSKFAYPSKPSFEYNPISPSSEDISESSSFIASEHTPHKPQTSRFANRPWLFFLTVTGLTLFGFLTGCSLTYLSMMKQIHAHERSFETGYSTEFTSARGAIEVEEVTFTSGLDYREDGSLYRIADPNGPDYVGAPSKEVDAAWKELIHDRYTAVYEEEAAEIGGGIYLNAHSKMYSAGVGVLHTLHCLNEIRKGLNRTYYPVPNPEWGQLHVEHCIDHVRQYIQCHGDLTPLPVQYSTSANMLNANFLQTHTCRNFQKLRDWATNHNIQVQNDIRASRKGKEEGHGGHEGGHEHGHEKEKDGGHEKEREADYHR